MAEKAGATRSKGSRQKGAKHNAAATGAKNSHRMPSSTPLGPANRIVPSGGCLSQSSQKLAKINLKEHWCPRQGHCQSPTSGDENQLRIQARDCKHLQTCKPLIVGVDQALPQPCMAEGQAFSPVNSGQTTVVKQVLEHKLHGKVKSNRNLETKKTLPSLVISQEACDTLICQRLPISPPCEIQPPLAISAELWVESGMSMTVPDLPVSPKGVGSLVPGESGASPITRNPNPCFHMCSVRQVHKGIETTTEEQKELVKRVAVNIAGWREKQMSSLKYQAGKGLESLAAEKLAQGGVEVLVKCLIDRAARLEEALGWEVQKRVACELAAGGNWNGAVEAKEEELVSLRENVGALRVELHWEAEERKASEDRALRLERSQQHVQQEKGSLELEVKRSKDENQQQAAKVQELELEVIKLRSALEEEKVQQAGQFTEAQKQGESKVNVLKRLVCRLEEEREGLLKELTSEVHRRTAAEKVVDNLEHDMTRDSSQWLALLDVARTEASWLGDRVSQLTVEKNLLSQQNKSLAATFESLQLEHRQQHERVAQFEAQMASHRERVEAAEKLIGALREKADEAKRESEGLIVTLSTADEKAASRECELERMSESIGKLQHQKRYLEEENSKLTRSLEKAQSGQAKLRKEVSDWQEKSQASREEVSKLKQALEGLEQACEEFEARSQQESARALSADEDCTMLRQSLAEMKLELETVVAEVKKQSQAATALAVAHEHSQQALTLTKQHLTTANQHLANKASQLADITTRCEEAEHSLRTLRQTESELRSTLTVSLHQLSAANERAERLAGHLEEQEHKCQEACTKVGLLRAELEHCRGDLQAARHRVGVLEAQLEEKARVVEERKRECEGLRQSKEQAGEEVIRLRKEAQDLAAALASRSKKTEEAETERRRLESHAHEQEHIMASMQEASDSQLHDLLTTIARLEDQVQELREDGAAQDLHCQLLSQRLSNAGALLTSRDREIEQLRIEAAVLGEDLDMLGEEQGIVELKGLRKGLIEVRSEAEAWQGEAEERARQVNTLRSQLAVASEEWKAERGQLRAKLKETNGELEKARKQSETLRKRLGKLEEEVMEKEGQISILRALEGEEAYASTWPT